MATLAELVARATRSQLYQKALDIAVAVGLPVESWQAGDPTRSLYHYLAEILSTLEGVVSEYVAAGFLDLAIARAKETGSTTWLKILATQVYGVTVTEATFATGACTLTNQGGGEYTLDPGDITAKSTLSDKTYRNTTGGTLLSGIGQTLSLTFVADEAGSDSSAGPGEIDDFVSGPQGVTIANPTALVGLDEEAPEAVGVRCRAKLGALSPNGPRDAYVHVALTPDLTGTTNVTGARSIGDSDTGDVTLYLRGPSGPVAGADRDAVEAAVLAYATPLCITPTVKSATAVTIAVEYELWIYTSVGLTADEIADAIKDALAGMFTARPIGGDVIANEPGRIYHSMIESTIRGVYKDHAFRVELLDPSGDTDLQLDELVGEVAVLGNVTPLIHFVEPG